ncbi:MAG: WG repeat-containing protein [Bacteroidales bacterium]|nr:WG repeat-containing protein [Bacteroidales bacterium]
MEKQTMKIDIYLITGRAEHHFLRDLVDISLELKKMGYAVWDDYSHHCFKVHQSIRSEDMALRRHLIESAKCFLVYNYCWSLSSAAIHDIGVAIENGKPIIVVGEFDGVRLEKALNIKKKFPWVTVENWDMMMKHLVSICGKQPPVSAVKRVKEKSKLQHPDDPIPMQSKRTGKWGYCDKDGRSRCQYNYDKTYLFADGMGRVSVDGKFGYLGLNVREAILPQYAHARDFCCGLAPVACESRGPINKQKWGYIDKENNLIVPYDYDDADVFEPCGLARVKIGDKYGIIDTKGNFVIPAEFENIIIEWIGHNAPGRIKKDGKYGYVNSKGEIIATPLFDMANVFGEGLAVCKSGEQLFTIDIIGNRLLGLYYDNAKCFSEGLLPVCLNHTDEKGKMKELWGFCDRNGNEVIPCEYDDVLPFSDGYAAVCYRGKWGFIDHKNRVMIPFQYDGMDGKAIACGYFGSYAEGIAGAVASGKDVSFNKLGQEFLSFGLICWTPMYERGWMIDWEILPFDYPLEAARLHRVGIWPKEYYITIILASLMQHRLKEHPEEKNIRPRTR